MTVDFATFCFAGDAHRLHAPGHLERQVLSNGYDFKQIIIVYQALQPADYKLPEMNYPIRQVSFYNIEGQLRSLGIDTDKPQYQSPTDKHHAWQGHVVNHLVAASVSRADYIVFADSDCWIVKQPNSWVDLAIRILEQDPSVFIVSPNDGEPERKTQVISQQMFMARTIDFRNIDWNQPGYSGNPRDYPELPEYHAMGEGRMHHYCVATGRYRYVLPPEYRYWHHNRTTQDGQLETDMSKY